MLDCVQIMTGLTRPKAQNLLGRFLFSGWEAHEKPVTALSGGERRRLALAVLVASGANFLVLDEPTNHLDLESREALEAALEAFPGTILLVSHDRALLDAVAERTAAIEDGTRAALRRRLGRLRPRAARSSEPLGLPSPLRRRPQYPSLERRSRAGSPSGAVSATRVAEIESRDRGPGSAGRETRGEAGRGLGGRRHDRGPPPGAGGPAGSPGRVGAARRRGRPLGRREPAQSRHIRIRTCAHSGVRLGPRVVGGSFPTQGGAVARPSCSRKARPPRCARPGTARRASGARPASAAAIGVIPRFVCGVEHAR